MLQQSWIRLCRVFDPFLKLDNLNSRNDKYINFMNDYLSPEFLLISACFNLICQVHLSEQTEFPWYAALTL